MQNASGNRKRELRNWRRDKKEKTERRNIQDSKHKTGNAERETNCFEPHGTEGDLGLLGERDIKIESGNVRW